MAGDFDDWAEELAGSYERERGALRVTCVACPTQIEGEIEGLGRIYFRSRHGEWRCELTTTAGFLSTTRTIASGEDREFMSPTLALDLVELLISIQRGDDDTHKSYGGTE